MKKPKFFTSLIIVATILMLSASVTFAEYAPDSFGPSDDPTYDVIILTPGHSRTILFELRDNFLNDYGATHTTYVVTALGSGTLMAQISLTSNIGEGSEIIFATAGLIGFQPVFDYSYSSAPMLLTAEVPVLSLGFLTTCILYERGGPEFPVTMSMTLSLN
jgi:hypothetical protein